AWPTSADDLGPVGPEVLRHLLALRVGRDHRGTLDRRQRAEKGLVDGAGLLHRVRAHRSGEPLQEEILTLVAVKELLPEPCRGGVGTVLVDRLEVVAAHERI